MSRVFALATRPGLKKIPPSTGGASLAICWVFFFFFLLLLSLLLFYPIPVAVVNFLINQRTFFCAVPVSLGCLVVGLAKKGGRINAKMMSGNLSSLFTSVI